ERTTEPPRRQSRGPAWGGARPRGPPATGPSPAARGSSSRRKSSQRGRTRGGPAPCGASQPEGKGVSYPVGISCERVRLSGIGRGGSQTLRTVSTILAFEERDRPNG